MHKIYDTIIIGGGPAGYTAALYATRSGLDTLVIEKMSAGGQMALTHLIDNYPGFEEGVDGFELGMKMQKQAERFGATTINSTVLSLELEKNPKLVHAYDQDYFAKTIIIASGASPRELNIQNEEKYKGSGVAYCATCDGMFYRNKEVVIVGGGNSAVADALILSKIAKKVTLIHRRDELRANLSEQKQLEAVDNIEYKLSYTIEKLIGDQRLEAIEIKNLKTKELENLKIDGLFVSIGRKPASELVLGQLDLDESGYIKADETTKTNIEGVYAIGDVRTKKLRQIVTATADGAVAAIEAFEFISAQKG